MKKVFCKFTQVISLIVLSLNIMTTTFAEENITFIKQSTEETRLNLEEKAKGLETYTVRWGDSIHTISLTTHIPVDTLVKIATNDNNASNLLTAGSQLHYLAQKNIVFVDDTTMIKAFNIQTGFIMTEQAMFSMLNEFIPKEKEEIKIEESQSTEVTNEKEVIQQPISYKPVQSEPTNGYWVDVVATAYSYNEAGSTYATALGYDLRQTTNIIAVDPNFIPLGSRVYIPGYGIYIAGDTGGVILGNKIDIHMVSVADMDRFGIRSMRIQILN